METKEYFEKVMQDFNQNRKGRNLRKYCNDEGIMYSLYESCKMNELDFGRCIEDIPAVSYTHLTLPTTSLV